MAQITTRNWREPFEKIFFFSLKRKKKRGKSKPEEINGKNKTVEEPWASWWNLSWTTDLVWLKSWRTHCRVQAKPAPSGRVIQPQQAHKEGSVRALVFSSWPGWWWVFPPTWSQEYFPPVISPYKIHSDVFPIFYLLKKKKKERAALTRVWLLAGIPCVC